MNSLFRGETVYLDSLNEEDLIQILNWYKDPHFARLFAADIAQPKSLNQLKQWYEDAIKAENGFIYAIRTVEDSNLIGYVELNGILWNQQVGWVAIAIGNEQHRGKGFGKEAMELLIQFAFQECNLRRLQLTVFNYNEPAIHLYKSLGFQHEGTYREFLYRDGQPFDMLLYGLLAREWPKK